MRIRAVFAKTEPMRFTSHLDLYRAWERLLRRAGVELVFSQGYNPRPKQQSELPQLRSKLLDEQPPGIEIQVLEIIDPSAPPLQKKVTAAEYQVRLLDQVLNLDQKIDTILDSESILREKRGKTYDLRPLIEELKFEGGESRSIQMLLQAQEGGTGRPEEVLRALDIPPENSHIERTKLLTEN
jgi:uncharacterized protein (DUF2344 family)